MYSSFTILSMWTREADLQIKHWSENTMSQSNPDFREELRWNSYFVEGFYDKTHEEVRFAAEQFEEETGTEVTEAEIEEIVEDIVDDGLNSLIEDDDST